MVKAIGKLDVLAHPSLTIRCLGWKVFVKTLLARQGTVIWTTESSRPPAEKIFEIVRRFIRLEQTAHRIYASLAERFRDYGAVNEFFRTLAQQEEEHAELLEICRVAAMRGSWDGDCLDLYREDVPYVERTMREAELKLRAVRSPADAFWLTIEIESSEINELFEATIAATDSQFVRTLLPFKIAARDHLDYISRTISYLEPGLRSESDRVIRRRSCIPVPHDNEESVPKANVKAVWG